MKQVIALFLLIPNLVIGQIEFKSTDHYKLEQELRTVSLKYDTVNQLFIARSNADFQEAFTNPNIKYLTLEGIDTATIELEKFPNLKSFHLVNSSLQKITLQHNKIQGIWIDRLELTSNSIDLKGCPNLKHFKVDICQGCIIKNLSTCKDFEMVVLAGLYTDQKLTKELLTLKKLIWILLVEFKYSIKEAEKIKKQLKKKFPKAFVSIIL